MGDEPRLTTSRRLHAWPNLMDSFAHENHGLQVDLLWFLNLGAVSCESMRKGDHRTLRKAIKSEMIQKRLDFDLCNHVRSTDTAILAAAVESLYMYREKSVTRSTTRQCQLLEAYEYAEHYFHGYTDPESTDSEDTDFENIDFGDTNSGNSNLEATNLEHRDFGVPELGTHGLGLHRLGVYRFQRYGFR